ncbi:MAG: hypothetical protein K2K60_06460 [Clostridia bacterium]|nr:hypothetical protein [Clostridia bacterium]
MKSNIKKSSLIILICLLAVSLSGAAAAFAYARQSSYYVCFSNQNYAVRNANKMEYADNQYVLKNVALSSVIDFYVTDDSGTRWYASDNSPMSVDEATVLKYDILFSPENTFDNGSHISYRFYEPDTYSVNIGATPEKLTYNPYNTAYELYYISSIQLTAGTTVSYNGESHNIDNDGFYRILFTPEKTVNGNKFMFDEDGNYGSGDDYKYSLYISDAPQYYAVFDNIAVDSNAASDAEINGKPAYLLTRYEDNVAAAEYRSVEVFAAERDFGVKYCVYEMRSDGTYTIIDDDNNEDTAISKLTVEDVGWYTLSITDLGTSYVSDFKEEEKDFKDWYISAGFNGYCFDGEGNIDLSDEYKFVEVEDGDDDYDEDYTQYIAYLTVSEKQLQNGDLEFFITDGKTKFKDGADYIKISIAGKYKILCSDEHNYGRGRNYRFVLEDGNAEGEELTISTAQEFIAFAKNCKKSADYSVNLKVYLAADINFDGVEFVPVGAFSGTFYGGYHKLINVTCESAIFETLNYSATVERLIVENAVLGDKNADTVGVVGTNYGKVNLVTVTGKITGKNNVGGIVAVNGRSDTQTGDSSDIVNKASIENCKNEAAVSGETYVGGICGRNTGDIISCISSGEVNGNKTRSSATVAQVGGIAGYSFGKIYDCTNLAKVVGGDSSRYVGGIAGLCVGEMYFSFNRGNISADRYAGGIVGYYGLRQSENNGVFGGDSETDPVGSNNVINYAANYGAISANSYVGGIVGNAAGLNSSNVSNRVLKIYNCASEGNLEATAGSYAGGIAGYAAGVNIKSCLSSGTVQAKGMNGGKYVGGIVGYGGDIAYSMSAATIKGTDFLGGVAGYASSALTGCYSNALLLPAQDTENIGGIAGGAANYNQSKNEFDSFAGNYYIGEYGGICGTDFAAAFDYAAVAVSSETLASVGTLPPVLCEEFSREYWQGGEVLSFPVLRNFEEVEDSAEFNDEKLFAKLFDNNKQTFTSLTREAAKLTYTVTFMEWNKDNGELYDDGVLQTDNFDIVSAVRISAGQMVEIPALLYAQLNAGGKYVYEGNEARYMVSFPKVDGVNGNMTVYAQYREIVTSLTDSENKVFAEGEFVRGTQVALVTVGEYFTVEFTLDGEKITVENVTVKYLVGKDAGNFSVYKSDGKELDSFVSGRYVGFEFSSGEYFTLKEDATELPFWAWLLIGIGGTLTVAGITALTVYLVRKKRKKQQ